LDYITIALSKGRIGKQADNVFKKIGLGDCIDLDLESLFLKMI
jgi:ATP phosphoribosyltransferase